MQLASRQVLQASNHSHRSFINLLRFFCIFFLMQNKGSLFSCRLISVYLESSFPRVYLQSLSKHQGNSAHGRHVRFFALSLNLLLQLFKTHLHQVESEQMKRLQ